MSNSNTQLSKKSNHIKLFYILIYIYTNIFILCLVIYLFFSSDNEYYEINKNKISIINYLSYENNIKDKYENYNIIFLYSYDYLNIPEYAKLSIDKIKKYCTLHKYILLEINHYPNNDKSPYWLRVFDLISLTNQYTENSIFIYMDLDTIINSDYINLPISNLLTKIEMYDNKNYNIFIGTDMVKHNYLNTGVIILKNTNYTKKLLDIWSKYYNNNNWTLKENRWDCKTNYNKKCAWAGFEYEQGSLNYIYKNNIYNSRNNIKILHSDFISNRFTKFNSFIYHFMAGSSDRKFKLLKEIYFKSPFTNNDVSKLLNSNYLIHPYSDINTIPNIIFQTYNNKDKIPTYIFDNITTYANGYEHIIFNDDDALNFLNTYFSDIVINNFKSLSNGAHKADLLRYCYLYIHGGIYLDIKTILIKNIDDIFINKNCFYSCISQDNKHIYQGILASPPNNILFLALISKIVNTFQFLISWDYHIFVKDLYKKINLDLSNPISPGLNKSKNNLIDFYLFKEQCTDVISDSCPKLDRYGFCCSIYNNKEKIFIGRDPTYPWN